MALIVPKLEASPAMPKAKLQPQLRWLAHFVRSGAQDILAPTREEAVKKGERAARKLGTSLADLTGPEDDEP